MEKRILTLEEAADYLRIGIRTAYQMVKENRIPGRKIGKQWRFDRETILAWFNESSEGPLEEAPPEKSGGTRVLVVEDDAYISESFSESIRHHIKGTEVRIAKDGFSALVETGRFHPHVIIADVTIPRVDGLEICRILKHDPDLSDIAVILISGTPENNIESEAIAAGANAFMRKPVSGKEFVNTVTETLSSIGHKTRSGKGRKKTLTEAV